MQESSLTLLSRIFCKMIPQPQVALHGSEPPQTKRMVDTECQRITNNPKGCMLSYRVLVSNLMHGSSSLVVLDMRIEPKRVKDIP